MKDYFRIHCMGPETIEVLFVKGIVKSVADLYKLTPSDLTTHLDKCGSRLAKNLLTYQEYPCIPLHVFLGALNIHNTGTRTWSNFVCNSKYKTLTSVRNLTLANILDAQVDGIGISKATSMYDGIRLKSKVIDDLLDVGVRVLDEETEKKKETPITGKSFCITGTLALDRPAFEARIKDMGGTVKGVSKKLDYLIVGSLPGATKLDKADKYGVKVITEQEFEKLTKE